MQSRRWWQQHHHGSSGELDVFGATRYFAGRAVDCATAVAHPAAADDRLPESFRGHDVEQLVGVHDLRQGKEMEVELAKPKPAGDEPVKNASSLSSAAQASRRSTDDLITAGSSADAADDDVQVDGLDLGVATGERRLQGVKVVIRSTRSGANQETWVVRCSKSCWDDPHRSFDGAVSGNYYYVDDQVEEEEDSTITTDPHRNYHWESDSGSDLFDLDIESSVDL